MDLGLDLPDLPLLIKHRIGLGSNSSWSPHEDILHPQKPLSRHAQGKKKSNKIQLLTALGFAPLYTPPYGPLACLAGAVDRRSGAMHNPTGSYTFLGTTSRPMDMTCRNLRTHDTICAFPSWPRRSSLSDSGGLTARPTLFLSDDDLFLGSPLDDDAGSVSSSGSLSSPVDMAPVAGAASRAHQLTEEQILRLQREKEALQREILWQIRNERDRRRQMAPKSRRSSSKKSSHPEKATAGLAAIAEAGSE